jgi:hypothetical protein
MKKQNRRQRLVLDTERVRQLTANRTIEIVGGLRITDGTNATVCLATAPFPCEDNTAHFCTQA